VTDKKYEHGGQLTVKNSYFFMDAIHKPLHLRQIKFGAVKYHGHTFHLSHHFD
jgi:hypothetical protein